MVTVSHSLPMLASDNSQKIVFAELYDAIEHLTFRT